MTLEQVLASPNMLDTAVVLANEGVPVKAISRATKIPFEQLRDMLVREKEAGNLIEVPNEDWVKVSREERIKLGVERKMSNDTMALLAKQLFRITRQQALLLVALVTRQLQSKEQLHDILEQHSITRLNTGRDRRRSEPTHQKMVDVLICGLRKHIKPFNIWIETSWGNGYLMRPEDQKRAVELLTAYANGEPTEPQTPETAQ